MKNDFLRPLEYCFLPFTLTEGTHCIGADDLLEVFVFALLWLAEIDKSELRRECPFLARAGLRRSSITTRPNDECGRHVWISLIWMSASTHLAEIQDSLTREIYISGIVGIPKNLQVMGVRVEENSKETER